MKEISWRVAEPAVRYDPRGAADRLFAQPLKWLTRNVQIFLPLGAFFFTVVIDIVRGQEPELRATRATALLDIISAQSPALIKVCL